jgi:hypothetical protein
MAGEKKEVPFPVLRGPSNRPTQTVPEQKSLADLQAQYLRNQALRLQLERDRANPPQKPKTSAEVAREATMVAAGKDVGSTAGKARAGLKGAETKAKRALDDLSNLMKHPGLEAAVGLPNPFRGGFGIGTVPGTSARGFTTFLERVKSGAFLQAIEAMRGTGAISEAEGKAATAALNSMSTATSENDFKQAANDYARVIADGLSVARSNASLGSIPYTREQLEAERQRRLKARGQ